MYGYKVPNTYLEAVALDEKNGNTKWQDAIELEILCLHEYKVFKDLGHAKDVSAPTDYQCIKLTVVFAVKHDGRH